MSDDENESLLGKRQGDSNKDQSAYVAGFLARFVGATVITRLFRKKTVDNYVSDLKDKTKSVDHVLSITDLLFFGVGLIVGAGIFTIVGKAIQTAGPSIIWSVLFLFLACLVIGLCYAELASNIPVAGSAYTYMYITFGELPAWFVGWNLILEYTVSAAVIGRSWSWYLKAFFEAVGIGFPRALVQISFGSGIGYMSMNITAAIVMMLITMLVARGVKESVKVNIGVVCIKVGILIFFIVVGLAQLDTSHFSPMFPSGLNGMFTGAAMMFFAFIGFDSVSSLSEDAKNPRRDMPRAILGSLMITSVLYLLVVVTLIGLTKYTDISLQDPLASSLKAAWAKGFVAFAAVCGILTAMLGAIFGQSRIYMSMARDGLLSESFAVVDPVTRTPLKAVWLSGFPAVLGAFLFDIQLLGHLTSFGACTAFILVCSAVLNRRYSNEGNLLHQKLFAFFLFCVTCSMLSYTSPSRWVSMACLAALCIAAPVLFQGLQENEVHSYSLPGTGEKFKAPFLPYLPLIGIAFTTHLMVGQGRTAFFVYLIWQVVGFSIYFMHGVHNSRLA